MAIPWLRWHVGRETRILVWNFALLTALVVPVLFLGLVIQTHRIDSRNLLMPGVYGIDSSAPLWSAVSTLIAEALLYVQPVWLLVGLGVWPRSPRGRSPSGWAWAQIGWMVSAVAILTASVVMRIWWAGPATPFVDGVAGTSAGWAAVLGALTVGGLGMDLALVGLILGPALSRLHRREQWVLGLSWVVLVEGVFRIWWSLWVPWLTAVFTQTQLLPFSAIPQLGDRVRVYPAVISLGLGVALFFLNRWQQVRRHSVGRKACSGARGASGTADTWWGELRRVRLAYLLVWAAASSADWGWQRIRYGDTGVAATWAMTAAAFELTPVFLLVGLGWLLPASRRNVGFRSFVVLWASILADLVIMAFVTGTFVVIASRGHWPWAGPFGGQAWRPALAGIGATTFLAMAFAAVGRMLEPFWRRYPTPWSWIVGFSWLTLGFFIGFLARDRWQDFLLMIGLMTGTFSAGPGGPAITGVPWASVVWFIGGGLALSLWASVSDRRSDVRNPDTQSVSGAP